MARRYVMTPKRRLALRKAQLASARKRKGTRKAQTARRRKAIVVAGGVAAAGAGVYMLDRKVNTVKIYHNTSHSRAKRILKNGFMDTKAEASRRRVKVSHAAGDPDAPGMVYFAVGYNNARFFGPAALSTRVRKRKFNKIAVADTHPMVAVGGYYNFYRVPADQLRQAGSKRMKYSRRNRAIAEVKIRQKREIQNIISSITR